MFKTPTEEEINIAMPYLDENKYIPKLIAFGIDYVNKHVTSLQKEVKKTAQKTTPHLNMPQTTKFPEKTRLLKTIHPDVAGTILDLKYKLKSYEVSDYPCTEYNISNKIFNSFDEVETARTNSKKKYNDLTCFYISPKGTQFSLEQVEDKDFFSPEIPLTADTSGINYTPQPEWREAFEEFKTYLEANPEQRFWQALRNISDVGFLQADGQDTFNWRELKPIRPVSKEELLRLNQIEQLEGLASNLEKEIKPMQKRHSQILNDLKVLKENNK